MRGQWWCHVTRGNASSDTGSRGCQLFHQMKSLSPVESWARLPLADRLVVSANGDPQSMTAGRARLSWSWITSAVAVHPAGQEDTGLELAPPVSHLTVGKLQELFLRNIIFVTSSRLDPRVTCAT